MEFSLCGRQRILLHRGKIIFCHKHFHCITMNERQFENFHDMLCEMNLLKLRAYPLGENLWIYRRYDSFCLTTHHGFFLFYVESWEKYKKRTHHHIRHIQQRHGWLESDQYDADNESGSAPQPRSFTSRSRRKTFSRETRNATASSQQRKKRSIISPRNDTNPWRYPRERSRDDATRDSPPPSPNNSNTASDIEYGSNDTNKGPILTET